MAEAIADNAQLGHEDDINFLEIDFDEAAGAVAPNDRSPADVAQESGAAGDDFDIQIDEFEVVDDASGHVDNGSVPSGDFTGADLGVPLNNTAESEIGYEDEEPLKTEASTKGFQAAGQEQGNSEIVDSTDNVDEIDYEDGDFEAIREDNIATEPRSALTTSKQQEIVTTQVVSQQVLDDTVEQVESAHSHRDADDGAIHESSETGQHVSEKDHRPSRTGGYPDDPVTSAPASEISDVMVLYNGIKYELCASVLNEDPETYFFAGNDEMDVPLSQFFGLLRDVIKDEIEPSDDLVIRVPQLKLEFGEESSAEFLEKHTFRNILDLYRRFKYNDGEDAEHAQLVVHLVPKPNCQERYTMLVEAADAGRGWSEFFDNSDGSDSFSGHHSDGGFDEEQADTGSGEDQPGASGDEMQHEVLEIVEEAYFYDDTNDAADHEAEHMLGDEDAEDPGHHADNVDNLNEDYGLALGELVDNVEFDQDDAAHQTYTEHDGNSPTSHGDVDFSTAAGAIPGGAGTPTGGSGPESSNDEAGSALDLAGGNDPLSFHTPPATGAAGSDEDFIDYSDDEDTSGPPAAQYARRFSPPPHFPRRYGVSILDVPTYSNRPLPKPRSEDEAEDEPDDDFIDYENDNIIPSIERDDDVFTGGESGITVPCLAWLNKAEAVPMPSASLARDTPSPMKPSSATRKPVYKYRGVTGPKNSEAGSSTLPGLAALMMEPQTAAQSTCASSSKHRPLVHSAFALSPSSNYFQGTGANLLDHQVHHGPASQSETGGEMAHDSVPSNDFEDGDDDNFAVNDSSVDMEGFAAYDEAADNEPLPAESNTQASNSHETSATSTVNGDEITYEDDNAALANTENGIHEAGDDTAANPDEIDWENDDAEDVAVAEGQTNMPSPSGLSVKRSREADDLTSLDDENDAKRRKT